MQDVVANQVEGLGYSVEVIDNRYTPGTMESPTQKLAGRLRWEDIVIRYPATGATVAVWEWRKTLRAVITRAAKRGADFSLEDAEAVDTDLEEGEYHVPAMPAEGGTLRIPVDADDREPVIKWQLLKGGETEDEGWLLAVKVRNPHVDLVFANLIIELAVALQSESGEEESQISLEPSTRLEFGNVGFSQRWITREVRLVGAGLKQDVILVSYTATWLVRTVKIEWDAQVYDQPGTSN